MHPSPVGGRTVRFIRRQQLSEDPLLLSRKTMIWRFPLSELLAISGLFSLPPTQIAIQTWGVDRILIANDYFYVDAQRVPDFVRALGDMIGLSDLRKICQTNSEALFKIEA